MRLTMRLQSLSRSALTLVEVMISVALSTVVLLLAFTAFRVAAQSISHLGRLETENNLLRHGITQVIDDVDFWNSEANPEFPYGRAYAAYQNVNASGTRLPDTDPDLVFNHGNNKRPFRRTAVVAGSAEDVNWQLPHDPRSWYRNMVYSNARPVQPDYIDGNPGYSMVWRAETWHPSTQWRIGGDQGNFSGAPMAWTPRHIWGDYAEIANVGYVPTADPAAEDSYRGARARSMQWLFREIGAIGLVNYQPPGGMMMYLRPSTNLYNGSGIADTATHFDKGEIPWQLDRPKVMRMDNSATIDQAKFGKWDSTVERPTAADVASHNRLNYMEALQLWHGLTARDWTAANRMRGLMYGVRVSEGTWPWATINAVARQAWSRDLLRDAGRGYGQLSLLSWAAGDEADANRNDTYLVPASLTGIASPLTSDRISTLPLLRVSNFRYRYYGGDICNVAVRLEQPSFGRVINLGFSVFGTTFRGARQHWALRTWGQQIGMTTNALEPGNPTRPAMGDFYQ